MIYKAVAVIMIGVSLGLINTPFFAESKSSEIVLSEKSGTDAYIASIYNNISTNNFSLPNKKAFMEAMNGYLELKQKGIVQKEILTIVDYTLSSKQNRLWVIDIENNSILYQSLVSHGRNSGDEFAQNFSNLPGSYKSSLGFYIAAETYFGKHGYSLRLDGMEKDVNNHARNRAIVIHGADYVSESFIEKHGRLGRSLGCLALSPNISKDIIDVIKGNTCLFVYYPS